MIIKLALKNLWFKPLGTILSIILLSSGIAIITLLLLVQKQFEKKFLTNVQGIDLVMGAKGSPLQLVLSSVYQIDAPTGNIKYEEAKSWINHPFVEEAFPLSFGDNYKGFRIVGTTPEYLEKFAAGLSSGEMFQKNLEVVIGSEVARKLSLKIGDLFHGVHGDSEHGHVHDDFPYKVVGIAAASDKVPDNLILCNLASVWAIHDEKGHEHKHEHADKQGCTHEHECDHEHECQHKHEHEHSNNLENQKEDPVHHSKNLVANNENDTVKESNDKEITAVIIKLKNKKALAYWPREIARKSNMQAVSPAIEINRLFSLLGIGIQAIYYLAYGIILISALSIFIALFNRLKERKFEFALLRIGGASRLQLFFLVLSESLILCFIGFVAGNLIGRISLGFISASTDDIYKLKFNYLQFSWSTEGVLIVAVLFLGTVAALIPALKAYKTNISKTLSNA